MSPDGPLVINGWTIYAHPLFLEQLDAQITQVEALRQKDPNGYVNRNAAKRLAAIARLAFEVIPQDPTRDDYRQGNTLGPGHSHWFRAKFFQQYRLFFRFHSQAKLIVYAWVNDQATKRAYGRTDDAYRVFRKVLATGHPPGDWDALLEEARSASGRLRQATSRTTGK